MFGLGLSASTCCGHGFKGLALRIGLILGAQTQLRTWTMKGSGSYYDWFNYCHLSRPQIKEESGSLDWFNSWGKHLPRPWIEKGVWLMICLVYQTENTANVERHPWNVLPTGTASTSKGRSHTWFLESSQIQDKEDTSVHIVLCILTGNSCDEDEHPIAENWRRPK